jgi:hypothetical protein
VRARKNARGGARPGAGRPRRLHERVSVTLHMEGAQRSKLAKVAATLGVSVSDLIREAVDEFLKHPRGKRR